MHLDEDIHDVTAEVQALLDKRGFVFLDSGTYLITKPLIIHDNTHLQLAPDAMMVLGDKSNCAIIENESLNEKGKKQNANIRIEGGIWNGNNENQVRRSRESRFQLTRYEDDYYYGILMRFVGVKNFYIGNLTVKDPESYAMLICGANDFTVENVNFDYNLLRPNMDGVHIQGPSKDGVIRNIKGTTNDDLVALNCDDTYASEITRGNIENMLVDGLFSEGGYTAVRLLSSGSEMKNIAVKNIFGTYRYYGVSSTHHNIHPGEPVWFENISIENIFASKVKDDKSSNPIIWFEHGVRGKNIRINSIFRTEENKSNAATVKMLEDVKIENFSLTDVFESIPGRESFILIDKNCTEGNRNG